MSRKLDVAGVLERVFEVYRSRAAVLLPAALIVFVIFSLVGALILSGGGLLVVLVGAALTLVAQFWYQAVVVETVAEAHSPRIGVVDLFRIAQPHLGPLIIAGVLAGVATAIGLAIFVVPGLILLTLWALLIPVIVLENARPLEAFGRSRELVRGNFMRVLGVIAVVYIVDFVVSTLLTRIGSGNVPVYFVTLLIAQVMTAPLAALAATIMYFDLLQIRGEPAPVGFEAEDETGLAEGGWPEAGRDDAYEAPAHGEPAARGFDDPAAVFDEQAASQSHHEPAAAAHDEPPRPAEPVHPADWYPDPRGEARLRYWDGTSWTDHIAD